MRVHRVLAPGDRVLVAVSGGPDSVGLLAVLGHLRRRCALTLVAAHVNHGLRGAQARRDEECAARAATRLGVPFVRADLGGELRPGPNLEERAREARYRALHRLATASGCTKIATGHTRDDQAETILLRLLRGAGTGGLAGIQPRRDDGVVRPLLDCRRADVEAAVRGLGLEFRRDRMNDDPRFLRTQVRRRVLPLLAELNPNIVDTLARTAAIESASRQIVAAFVERTLRAVTRAGTQDLDVRLLLAVPAAWRGHVLRRWLAGAGAGVRGIGARHVAAVERLVEPGAAGRVVELPGGRRVRRRGGRLLLGAAAEARPAAADEHVLAPGREVRTAVGWRVGARLESGAGGAVLPADLWTAAFDAGGLVAPLTVRAPRRGERVRPLGLHGSRKLSDVFIDRKVPAEERRTYPVVECGGEVLWVPGVVRAEGRRVGPHTRRILRLTASLHRPPS
jgi:tRNA(Ile)-lysidine synthase